MEDIKGFIKSLNIKAVPNLCNMNNTTKRDLVRSYLLDLQKDVAYGQRYIFEQLKVRHKCLTNISDEKPEAPKDQ